MRPLDSPKLPLKARKPLAGTTDARAPGSDAFASRLDEADTLVTDQGLGADARRIAGERVRELLYADTGSGSPAIELTH